MEMDFGGGVLIVMVKWEEIEEEKDDGGELLEL